MARLAMVKSVLFSVGKTVVRHALIHHELCGVYFFILASVRKRNERKDSRNGRAG